MAYAPITEELIAQARTALLSPAAQTGSEAYADYLKDHPNDPARKQFKIQDEVYFYSAPEVAGYAMVMDRGHSTKEHYDPVELNPYGIRVPRLINTDHIREADGVVHSPPGDINLFLTEKPTQLIIHGFDKAEQRTTISLYSGNAEIILPDDQKNISFNTVATASSRELAIAVTPEYAKNLKLAVDNEHGILTITNEQNNTAVTLHKGETVDLFIRKGTGQRMHSIHYEADGRVKTGEEDVPSLRKPLDSFETLIGKSADGLIRSLEKQKAEQATTSQQTR